MGSLHYAVGGWRLAVSRFAVHRSRCSYPTARSGLQLPARPRPSSQLGVAASPPRLDVGGFRCQPEGIPRKLPAEAGNCWSHESSCLAWQTQPRWALGPPIALRGSDLPPSRFALRWASRRVTLSPPRFALRRANRPSDPPPPRVALRWANRPPTFARRATAGKPTSGRGLGYAHYAQTTFHVEQT
jgi:hypothetical protein